MRLVSEKAPVRRKDAERFVEEVREEEPDLAKVSIEPIEFGESTSE